LVASFQGCAGHVQSVAVAQDFIGMFSLQGTQTTNPEGIRIARFLKDQKICYGIAKTCPVADSKFNFYSDFDKCDNILDPYQNRNALVQLYFLCIYLARHESRVLREKPDIHTERAVFVSQKRIVTTFTKNFPTAENFRQLRNFWAQQAVILKPIIVRYQVLLHSNGNDRI